MRGQGRRQTVQVGDREQLDGRDQDAVEVLHVARGIIVARYDAPMLGESGGTIERIAVMGVGRSN
jgi:hypothetical protein